MPRNFRKHPIRASVDPDEVIEIRGEVETYLYERIYNLLEELTDNLAVVLMSEVPGYDADWCAEGQSESYEAYIAQAVNMIVDSKMDQVFENAPLD